MTNYFNIEMVRNRVALLVASLVTLTASVSRSAEDLPRLYGLDGSIRYASLVQLSSDGSLTLRLPETTPDETTRVATSEFYRWGDFADVRQGCAVVLADGGIIVASDPLGAGLGIQLANGRVAVRSPIWQEIELPRAQVRGAVLRLPADSSRRDRLIQSLMTETGEQDRVALANGDVFHGEVTAIDNTEVRMRFEGTDLAISVLKVLAVVFAREDTERVAGGAVVSLLGGRDGSRLAIARLDGDGNEMSFRSALGFELRPRDADSLSSILVAWQPASKQHRCLSDLPSQAFRHIPLLAMSESLHVDQNQLGGYLRKDGRIFLKGLAMPVTSRVAFALDEQQTTFVAVPVIDDAAGLGGSVVFRVYGSENGRDWKTLQETGTVRGGDPIRSLQVDVRGFRFLALIVEEADRANVLDYAEWLDARLIHEVLPVDRAGQ
ncbi:MAG: NPCBM/NEW2 domain-containing protein [Planctomycetales bacterium]|nr:NPCBM/NEW2 domain-containing protein [Planctomycetales bacterium]